MRPLEGNRTGKGVGRWTNNRQLVGLAYQRYLLQSSYVDRLLGKLVQKMEETGLFDRALLVVVSDHGKSFVPGKGQRPSSDCASHCVPLFIKLPGQTEGVVSDHNVETIDILPTIMEVLKISSPWEFDGRSLLSPESGRRAEKSVFGGGVVTKLKWPGDYLERAVHQLSNLKASVMSADVQATLGPSPELIGERIQDVVAMDIATEIFPAKLSRGGLGFVVDQDTLLENVRPESYFVPTYITGRIVLDPGDDRRLSIALAINGVIQATTYTFNKDRQSGRFALLVPESVIVPGRNTTSILLLQGP